MLQNRVDPMGQIIKTTARGSLMGNRGILHDNHQTIIRPYKIKAWITCVLAFKDRRRTVMTPDRYTELFFLDEATSFSAGHRPCFECRRAAAEQFKSLWLKGNPDHKFDPKIPVKEIDNILHTERMRHDHSKVTYEEYLSALPDGTFILWAGAPHLIRQGFIYPWSSYGYSKKIPLPGAGKVTVLTPASIVRAFQAGYLPQMAV